MKRTHLRGYFYIAGQALLHLVILLIVVAATSVRATGQLSDSEAGRQVMVDYIVHFAHHLQWPIEVFSGTDAPFRICFMGEEHLREPLAARLGRQRVNGRRVEISRVSEEEPLRARECQIVVLGALERVSLREVIGVLEFFPVLTVSDAEQFAATGGIIGFVNSGDNITLQLNKTMLDRAELEVGNSLFRLSQKLN